MNNKFKINKNNQGNLIAYTFIFILVALVLVVTLFFPQYIGLKSGVYKLACNEIIVKIQEAVETHDANFSQAISVPSKLVDLDLLMERGCLKKILTCPENGLYMFDAEGRVYCTKHSDE